MVALLSGFLPQIMDTLTNRASVCSLESWKRKDNVPLKLGGVMCRAHVLPNGGGSG